MLFETILTEHNSVRIRVRANSAEEAEEVFEEFNEKDANEYCSEELDLNGTREWVHTEFTKVSPTYYDECATITKNDDGTFDAIYEGGDK